jgi:hypothetical protein
VKITLKFSVYISLKKISVNFNEQKYCIFPMGFSVGAVSVVEALITENPWFGLWVFNGSAIHSVQRMAEVRQKRVSALKIGASGRCKSLRHLHQLSLSGRSAGLWTGRVTCAHISIGSGKSIISRKPSPTCVLSGVGSSLRCDF